MGSPTPFCPSHRIAKPIHISPTTANIIHRNHKRQIIMERTISPSSSNKDPMAIIIRRHIIILAAALECMAADPGVLSVFA